MELRKKLTILFLVLIASIIITSSFVIYFWFAEYRKTEFYDRLSNEVRSVAELLIDVDQVDATLLKKIENTKPVSFSDEKITIYNYKNEVIYDKPHASLQLPKEKLDKVRVDDELEYNEGNYEVLAVYFKGKYDRVVAAIAAKDTNGLSKLRKLKMILIFVSCFSIVLVYFSGLFFIGKALDPVATIINQVDSITISNLNQRLYEGNQKDDIAKLAMTFNKMLQRLEASFMTQRVFIANASHELRTPLTVITGQLEIVLIKDRTGEEYAKIIRSVLDDMVNVNQLANRLLLIAQANSNFGNVELSNVRLDDVVWNARQDIRKRYPDYSIKVFFGEGLENEGNMEVKGNQLLLKTAIGNLMENACKYSHDKFVEIFVESVPSSIQVRFVDHGMGIAPEEMGMIFEPFYRGKNTTGIRGHGIGLSLVRNIINVHGGRITVTSEVNAGSEFTLTLPLSVSDLST